MATKVTLIENLEVSMANEPLALDQLIVAALFGGDLKVPAYYDSTVTYNKNDKILYKDPTTGKIYILYCKHNATTGTFDLTKWSQCSLFDGAGSGSGSAMGDVVLLQNLDNTLISRLLHI